MLTLPDQQARHGRPYDRTDPLHQVHDSRDARQLLHPKDFDEDRWEETDVGTGEQAVEDGETDEQRPCQRLLLLLLLLLLARRR